MKKLGNFKKVSKPGTTLILILLIMLSSSMVWGEGGDVLDFVIGDRLESLTSSDFDNVLRDVLRENNIFVEGGTKEIVKRIIKGEKVLEGESLWNSISIIFFDELRLSMELLSKILIITLISTILTNLQNSFEDSSISEMANYVTYILISILVIASFSGVMDMATITVNRMVNFMQILLPMLLTLLVLTGGPSARILFHPMILATVNIVGVMIKNIIFPLIYFSFIVSIVSNLSKRVELGKLSELARQIITFIISAAFTIFIGILTIYGLSTKIDGITIRTAKFAVDKFVPVVGGFLSDAVDAVIGSSTILKNGIGIIGLIVIALIILAPLIKVAVLLLVYKLIGAIIEPIASPNIVKFFTDISKTLLLILISMVSITIMFFITITIIVDTSNSLLMLR